MSSTRVSSLLDRFKFEQKPKKQIKISAFSSGDAGTKFASSSSSANSERRASKVSSGSGGEVERQQRSYAQRPSTPELSLSDGITCIPDTPTSELPESIESGSPVFPSSSAEKRAAESSQRSLVGSTISSLLSPSPTPGDADKSPTFGKSKHLTNGHVKGERSCASSSKNKTKNKGRNRQRIHFTDSESDSDSGEEENSLHVSPTLSPKFGRVNSKGGGSESDSTHITNMATQDSLETVAYSYEDNSESSRRSKDRLGVKRKLSELSSSDDGENAKSGNLVKGKREAVEQLRICFPNKTSKELVTALTRADWNINHAANEMMKKREGSAPQRKQLKSEETKEAPIRIKNVVDDSANYQNAFSGWLQKPTATAPVTKPIRFTELPKYTDSSKSQPKPSTSQKRQDPPPKPKTTIKHRRVISSSDDESDSLPDVMRDSEHSQPKSESPAASKKAFRRIRTFSSDSMEDMSPVKGLKSNSNNGTNGVDNGEEVVVLDDDSSEDRTGASGNHKDKDISIAKSFYKKGAVQNGGSARKPPRSVWTGFISKEDQKENDKKSSKGKKSSKDNKSSKAGKTKATVRRRRYSSSDDDALNMSGSDSEYEEEVEVSPEFQAMTVSFFNDASLEELISIDGCSKTKAEKIISIRPFDDFAELQEKLDSVKGLGSYLVWSCESVFVERRVMEDLMQRCTNISTRIQKMVNAVIENPDSATEGQITRQPSLLNRNMTLKPYQLIGLNWLKLMHAQSVNGILADEMGLGKTIQVIAFLAQLLEEGNKGPHLVVAPSSTVDNWMREFQTWCPSLDVILYHGSQDDRQELRDDILYNGTSCNVIVTSYNLTASPKDQCLFRKLPLQYAIFDEGHMLKNMKSQRFAHLMKIAAERRLVLTGTPLQNNLQELISLLAFTLPNLFGIKASKLTRVFAIKKQKGENPHEQSNYEMERIAHAKQIMQPFVLRRLKRDVLSQLPDKVEQVEHIEMEEDQSLGYTELIATLSRDFKKGLIKSGAAAMMELRKQANHPLLIRRHYDDKKLRVMAKLMLKEPTHYDANVDYIFEDMQVMSDFELHRLCHEFSHLTEHRLDQSMVLDSGKFRFLDQKLKELKGRGDRVLLFSQFVIVLDIVEEYLKMRGHKFLRMDGQTQVSERQKLMDKFNNDDSVFIFMLSTRAGGVGINLTAANTVILHDIDFNPYNDKQAEDRCHRVGQTRTVTVIRLVSKNTIEEAMLSCARYKLKLEQQMTSSGVTGEDGEKKEHKDIESLLKDALDI